MAVHARSACREGGMVAVLLHAANSGGVVVVVVAVGDGTNLKGTVALRVPGSRLVLHCASPTISSSHGRLGQP
ncbi:hypothetical protein LX32DRAFT_700134 [Colletotrichum zoysiae]|uniref:Uncharacterized protein n=1 Tax=Colletotrichum zoysiae TaxID=1216348 RepID=A0AAD9H2Z6_9PEZI|nr:hypothetical protein LX32DRAFT_700134 [Colletotrichum zoysiae]